jgi:CubicO group peptidase (beta-lactamase class C family)
MEKKLYSLLVILLITMNLFSQKSFENAIYETENSLLPVHIFKGEKPYKLQERMEYYKVPGISISVIEDYEVKWTKYYGYADLEDKIPVTDQTLFNVGSLSKGVASLTVLSLIQNGTVKLDEDVNKYLISWKIPDNEFSDSVKVTPRLLMNHTSGAMHHFALNYSRENVPSITDYLIGRSPARERPTIIDKIPGTGFQYSNPGFAILQQMVEDITHKSFYEVASENIFTRIGMEETSFCQPLPKINEKYAAAGYRGYSSMPVKRYFYPNTAAGGLWTTTEDYAKFVIELMNSYHGKSNTVISQELTKEMLSPHATDLYGLGVFLRNYGGEEYFGHMGDNAGFFAGYLAHISNGNGVIVFTNSNTSPELIREIIKAVAKVYNWPNFLPKEIEIVDIQENILKSVSGRYRSGSDDLIEISYKEGALYLDNFGNEKLFHTGENVFKIKRRKGEIKFVYDSLQQKNFAIYRFADNIGRLSDTKVKAVKLKENERIPREFLEDEEFKQAEELYKKIFFDNQNDPSVSENRLNRMGYEFISRNLIQQAIFVFKLNTEFYPNSSNCYDSYGEALALDGRIEEAVMSYQKAVDIDPNADNAKKCLKDLRNKLPGNNAELDFLLSQKLPENEPGAAIIVLSGDSVSYESYFGCADLKNQERLNRSHMMGIASMSKQFLGMALLYLVDEGKLKLDDDISEYNTDLPLNGRKISIRQLVSHTSGLPEITQNDVFMKNIDKPHSVKEIIDVAFIDDFRSEPGEKFLYCNTGYTIAVSLIEKLSVMKYSEFLEKNIFEPLHMNNTYSCEYEHDGAEFTQRYLADSTGFKEAEVMHFSNLIGGGGIISNVSDLGKWCSALLNGHNLPSNYKLLWDTGYLNSGEKTEYGLGMGISSYRGMPFYYHPGMGSGMNSINLIFPEEDLAVVEIRNISKPKFSSKEIALFLVDYFKK